MNHLSDYKHIPDWANWIARDNDGSWWAYETEPHLHDNGWYENEVGRIEKLADLLLEMPWQRSLTPTKSLDFPEPPPKL